MIDGECGFKAIDCQFAGGHVHACVVDQDMNGRELMQDVACGTLNIVEVGKISMDEINSGVGKSREFRFE